MQRDGLNPEGSAMKTSMKQQHLLPVALILLILIALGVRIWASNQAVLIEGPTHIRVGTDGVVFIASETNLYLHDLDGGLIDVIPVSRFGMERIRGDFWVFENRDILFRQDIMKNHSCRRELEIFFRISSNKEDNIDTPDGILQRCSPDSYRCQPFGSGSDAFKKSRVYRLAVDEGRDAIYIADTEAHQLLLYDLNGKLKRKSDVRFNFPNGIVIGRDGLLYVADTNNQRVVAVKPDYSSFGLSAHEFSIRNTVGPPEKVWPFILGEDQNGRWWVANADNEMRHGDLVIYERNGAVFKRVELPDNADPTSIAVLRDQVLVTDPSLMRVYSVALNGEVMNEFGSLTFKLDCAEKLRKKNWYDALSSLSLYLIVAGAIAALILAWKTRALPTKTSRLETAGSPVSEENDVLPRGNDAPAGVPEQADGGTVSARQVATAQGWNWLGNALGIVKSRSRIYFVILLAGILQWQGISKIPKAGFLLFLLLSPLITGMLMILIRKAMKSNFVTVQKINIRTALADLLLTGVAYSVLFALTALAAQIVTGKVFLSLLIPGRYPATGNLLAQGADVPLLIGLLFFAIIALLLSAASWFAPPLIVFRKLSYFRAMALSLKAVVRNLRAFSLFSIVLCGIFLLSLAALFLIPGILFIPLGLAKFINPVNAILTILFIPLFAPLITLSVYTSYIGVFETMPEQQPAEAEPIMTLPE